jgi:hypothetical protein
VLRIGVDSVMRLNDQAHQAFVDERHEFANSPAGFPYLATTALNAWKTDIELEDVDVQAAGEAPGDSDGSPATGEIHSGFCVVSLTPRTLERSVGAAEDPAYRQDALWVAVARQVGRCVDVSRDESGAPVSGMSFKSLAPVDAFGIANSHDYFLATKKTTTRKWREGFADAFAVGWMRLAKPEYARQLADSLRHEHELNASDDSVTSTGCAIEPAMQAATPASLEELPAWTDRVRASACAR